jgi:hypothetical protein
VKARLAAIAAFLLLLPAAAPAAETPWGELKKLFHEPVTELKQQFKQLKQNAQPKAPKASKSAEPPAEAKAVEEKAAPAKPEAPVQEAVEAKPEPAPAPATAATDVAETEEVPIPRPRPEITFSYAAAGVPLPPEKPAFAAIGALTPPGRSLIAPPPAARSTCGAALAALGVEATPMAKVEEGACGIAQPVAVAALEGGAVDLSTKAIIECDLAETLANWIRDEVQPEARQHFGGKVTGLRIAASYTCRPRNGVSGAKLSEHGKGNAIDIAAFNVSGHGWITVAGAHYGDEARFLREVRASACNPFTTVLGPGSDSYHSDHFHLDLAKRRTAGPSKGLYCK